MATNLGTAVNFGYATTTNGITITGISGFLLQEAEHEADGDNEQIRDADGDVVADVHYNATQRATITAVITGTGLANAITNTTKPAKGTILVISACASDTELVATNWVVMRSRITGSNTTAKRLTIEIEKHAGITAAASA